MHTTQPALRAQYPVLKILLAGVIAIVASIIANLLVRWIGMFLIDVPADFAPLASIQPIIMFTAIFILIATIVWFAITRISQTPVRTWNIVVVVAFVISILPDLFMPFMAQPIPNMGTFTWGATSILIAMHVVSGLITWWALPRFSRV